MHETASYPIQNLLPDKILARNAKSAAEKSAALYISRFI